jgi:subtilase family serine protease
MNLQSSADCSTSQVPNWRTTSFIAVLVTLITALAAPAFAAVGQQIAHNTPPYVSTAKNLGTENPSKVMEVSLWLQPHNRAQMDQLARELYDRNSPQYRHFLTSAQFASRFAPSATELKTVREFLEWHDLTIVKTDPHNFFVRARGTVGDMQKAFHVVLNNYEVRGKTIRANDRDPYIEGEAAPLVRSVSGLDSGEYEHPLMQRSVTGTAPTPKSMASLVPSKPLVVADAGPVAPDYSITCFTGTETDVFSNNANGSLPIATYKGNVLNLQSLTSDGCAYTPPSVYTAYNLNSLYKAGLNGTGQTIGIIDWCGSLTIQNDANAFSSAFGLPQLGPSNFAITYIPAPSACEAADDVEINIDVEWAHAIAPGANINLIVPPSASFLDVDDAEYTAVTYGLANVISGSYGSPESFTPQNILDTESFINQIAAMTGISAQFSSGDSGDFSFDFIPPTVSAPADSPYATAVGGVTLALNADHSVAWQAGWGNNQTLLAEAGVVYDPAVPNESGAIGFIGGSGGGMSNCATQSVSNGACLAGFPKPSFQKTIRGKYRQMPDISWLADPYTGVAIVISLPGQVPEQVWQVWGGTSVAAPMFSGLWAIANQAARAPLGQAAQYVYSLPAGAVTDVVPVSSKTNVTGKIVDSCCGTTAYTADQVMGGEPTGKFVSAIWDYAFLQDTALVISFGTDCDMANGFGTIVQCNQPNALRTEIGWDNVTGVGTPNGHAFVQAFIPAK